MKEVPLPRLTDAEFEIMDIVWDEEETTINHSFFHFQDILVVFWINVAYHCILELSQSAQVYKQESRAFLFLETCLLAAFVGANCFVS